MCEMPTIPFRQNDSAHSVIPAIIDTEKLFTRDGLENDFNHK